MYFREKKNQKDKMKTKVDPMYIPNMYDKKETEIDRDHNPSLCLLPFLFNHPIT